MGRVCGVGCIQVILGVCRAVHCFPVECGPSPGSSPSPGPAPAPAHPGSPDACVLLCERIEVGRDEFAWPTPAQQGWTHLLKMYGGWKLISYVMESEQSECQKSALSENHTASAMRRLDTVYRYLSHILGRFAKWRLI